jgi:hypothetical protein
MEMNLLRCPGCDRVLEAVPPNPWGELRCTGCKSYWDRDYLDQLNQPRMPIVESEEKAVFSVPDISARINRAVLPTDPFYHRKFRNTFFWSFGVFMVLGMLSCGFFGILERPASIVEMLFLSVFTSAPLAGTVALFIGLQDPRPDITVGEAIKQRREENRRSDGDQREGIDCDPSPKVSEQSTHGTDAITHPSSDYQT